MRNLNGLWSRPIAAGLILFVAMPLAQASAAAQQAGQQTAPATQTTQTQEQAPSLETRGQSTQATTPQAAGQTTGQQQTGDKPVGTAAAPLERTTGVTASRPAGAVIAPAKQKRARTIIIRVGIVIGAAIAVGAVVGLSKASPSRPSAATAAN